MTKTTWTSETKEGDDTSSRVLLDVEMVTTGGAVGFRLSNLRFEVLYDI